MSQDDEIDNELMEDLVLPDQPRREERRPLKKKEPEEVPHESDEEPEIDEFGFYLNNEEDRERLLNMPEKQREEILYERIEKHKDALERRRFMREKQGLAPEPTSTRQLRERGASSTKAARKIASKNALEDIRARREQKVSSKRRTLNASDEEYAEETEEPAEEVEFPADEDKRDDYDGEENAEEDNTPREELTMDHIISVTVDRNHLEKWYLQPYWPRVARGLFARVMIGAAPPKFGDAKTSGAVYRLAEIIDVVESTSSYKLGKKECNHMINCKIGDKTKSFQMQYVSNQIPSQEEFNVWMRWLEKMNEEPPTITEIKSLQKQIHDASTYVFSEEDVNKQIEMMKEKNPSLVTNIARERVFLIEMITQEKENGNLDKAAELERQLADLVEREKEQTMKIMSSKKVNLANINQKNKDKNIATQELGRTLYGDESTAEASPFTQRKAGADNSWVKGLKRKSTDVNEEESREEKKEEEQPRKKQKISNKTDVDLDISFLFNSKSAPSTPSVLKPISATPSSVSSNTGDKKTLSLLDYRRQRGLQ
eukprot:TRINITY_DN4442_c0_g1_i1.p1 TRINITY_DN4442_c0_g1~~TRINITY_DN4442_c0_g1_i1.p1  ORF type:complete len:543 (-),score=160.34 TRINITY_DN4442_c0_g1_i1:155-1783(-)